MKYNCELIKDLLPLYQDRMCSNVSSKVVEEHLNECNECRLFYKEVKKTTDIAFKSSLKTVDAGGYLSLAKRLRKTKWYWRFCIGILIGITIFLSLMYADGNRFGPIRAAYASNIINKNSNLVAEVPMGNERILYIYNDNGQYRDIDVTYKFPCWKYSLEFSNKPEITDPNSEIQMITRRTYANSNNSSLYIVYAAAVNDKRIAYIELGKEGMMQRKNVDSKVTVFLWDETGKWDGTNTWGGMIKDSELRGIAYAKDGTVLYNLKQVSESNGQDSLKWIPVK